MDSLNFVYWLQGFMEMADPTELNSAQVQMIKDHLALVLPKVTPTRNRIVNPGFVLDPMAGKGALDALRTGGVCSSTADSRTISLC